MDSVQLLEKWLGSLCGSPMRDLCGVRRSADGKLTISVVEHREVDVESEEMAEALVAAFAKYTAATGKQERRRGSRLLRTKSSQMQGPSRSGSPKFSGNFHHPSFSSSSLEGIVPNSNNNNNNPTPVAFVDGPSSSSTTTSSSSSSSSSSVALAADVSVPVTIDDFKVIQVIGRGAFGSVMKSVHKQTGQLYAVKMLEATASRDVARDAERIRERDVLRLVDSPFLVKMWYDFTDSYNNLYLVMDLVTGGELFHFLRSRRRLSEDSARAILAEIVCAIEHLHARGIMYRDLKPENILITGEGHIKIVDFGLAKAGVTSVEGDKKATFCGSPQYLAPEVLKGDVYGLAVDWWSMGVLAFEMLVGRVPFAATNRNELYALTIKGAIEFPNTMSTNAVSFIRSLLVRNPRDRLGSVLGPAAIKNHPFFSASESGIDWVRVSCGEVPCAELLTRGLERKKEPASPSPGKTADNDGLSNNTHTNQKHFSSTAPQLALSSPPSSSSPHPSLPISNLSPEMKARQIAKRGRDVLSKSAVLPLSIGSARSFDAGSRSREQGSDLDALLASMQQHHENGW